MIQWNAQKLPFDSDPGAARYEYMTEKDEGRQ